MNSLQCGASSRAQDSREGSSGLAEGTRSKRLQIQAAEKNSLNNTTLKMEMKVSFRGLVSSHVWICKYVLPAQDGILLFSWSPLQDTYNCITSGFSVQFKKETEIKMSSWLIWNFNITMKRGCTAFYIKETGKTVLVISSHGCETVNVKVKYNFTVKDNW